ncbi:PAS fold and PAS fold-3 domain containing protein [Aphelenchoides besseyi]|nr:PAS fold and PAS fold-3 domain containing protein [Aphelenchoides besseyi]
MYAGKRRQRNFKRVRECPKPATTSNPSKRHRERLNGELETVAALLPFDELTLQRLDKLSVLRLAVSYLQIKAHFHACFGVLQNLGACSSHPMATIPVQMGPVPSFQDPHSGMPLIDPLEPLFTHVALRALGGFLLILNENGEIYYVSENIEYYLGFLQRIEIRGRFTELHAVTSSAEVTSTNRQTSRFGLLAVCTPFVPPILLDSVSEDPILKTKHALDLTLLCMDGKFRQLIEADESPVGSYYNLIHPADARYVSEAHSTGFFDVRVVSIDVLVIKNSSSGLMIYRLIGRVSGEPVYLQSSLRVFFKNSKAESIGGTHRILNEVDGLALLEKRSNMKSKYLTFDDTLLQSPRQLSSIANLQQTNPFFENCAKIAYDQLTSNTEGPSLNNIVSVTQSSTAAIEQSQIFTQLADLPSTATSLVPIQNSPSTSSQIERTAMPPPNPFLSAPLLPFAFQDHSTTLATDIRGLTTTLPFPSPATDAEHFWLHVDPSSYYLDYTTHPPVWPAVESHSGLPTELAPPPEYYPAFHGFTMPQAHTLLRTGHELLPRVENDVNRCAATVFPPPEQLDSGSRKLFVLVSLFSILVSSNEPLPVSLIALNSCFRFIPEVRIQIHDDEVAGTESIEFKDDCLRACLRSMIQKDCLLTTSDLKNRPHSKKVENDYLPPSNYYENLCASDPFTNDAIFAETKFDSYRGGEGILRITQNSNAQTKALLVLNGVSENTKIEVSKSSVPLANCYKLKREELSNTKSLLELESDPTGMVINPWTDIDLDLTKKENLEATILVVNNGIVIGCGKLERTDGSTASSSMKFYVNVYMLLLLLSLTVQT